MWLVDLCGFCGAAGGQPASAKVPGGISMQPSAAAPEPPQPQIQLTEKDRQAVEHLMALGFPRDQATEVYLACERNEERAANFLFGD